MDLKRLGIHSAMNSRENLRDFKSDLMDSRAVVLRSLFGAKIKASTTAGTGTQCHRKTEKNGFAVFDAKFFVK